MTPAFAENSEMSLIDVPVAVPLVLLALSTHLSLRSTVAGMPLTLPVS